MSVWKDVAVAIIAIPKALCSDPLMQEKKLPGFGKCIYCGATDVALSDEHVLPRGMNGFLVIENASCAACAEDINKFEAPIMQRHFGLLRRHLGFRSRKKLPYKAPVELFLKNGRRIRARVTLDDHPLSVPYIVHTQHPTFEDGIDYQTFVDLGIIHLRSEEETQRIVDRLCKRFGAVYVTTPMEVDMGMISRLVCKVGHGLAVAQFGIHNFQPVTLAYIRGLEDVYPGYYVGGARGLNDPSDRYSSLTMLEVRPLRGRPAVYAHVGLFSGIGYPIYTAVVGFLERWDDEVERQAGFSHQLVPNLEQGNSYRLERS